MINKIRRYHPGRYLKDNLEVLQMSNEDFSSKTGIPQKTIEDIINEKTSLTLDIATKIAEYFDSSVDIWMNLQKEYDLYLSNKS